MTDDRPYAERRGEYAASKFGLRGTEPRNPQDIDDAVMIDPKTGEPCGIKPAWEVEFESTIAPGLSRPGAPRVTHGFSHLKGSR